MSPKELDLRSAQITFYDNLDPYSVNIMADGIEIGVLSWRKGQEIQLSSGQTGFIVLPMSFIEILLEKGSQLPNPQPIKQLQTVETFQTSDKYAIDLAVDAYRFGTLRQRSNQAFDLLIWVPNHENIVIPLDFLIEIKTIKDRESWLL